jgi:hypothetical protein
MRVAALVSIRKLLDDFLRNRLWPDENSADRDTATLVNTEKKILIGNVEILKFRRQNRSYEEDHEATF